MSRARVTRLPAALGGWTGELRIVGGVLRVIGDEPSRLLEIECAQVRRFSFNSLSGMWAVRMRDRRKLYLQTSGSVISADRSAEGRQANDAIASFLRSAGGRGFTA